MPATPYSYRSDPAVPRFDDGAPLLIFDGECVLCSAGIQWMLARDPDGATRFAAIQEEIPRALYTHYHLDADKFDTFMVLMNGRPFLRWAGVLAAARTLPAPWRWLGQAGRFLPSFIGDRFYDLVQRRRIGWFGRRANCFVPSPANRNRFVTGAVFAQGLPLPTVTD